MEKDFLADSLLQTLKSDKNRNETPSKNGIKFTGIFAFLVLKLQILLVLKFQTRATLEQMMLPMENEQVRTIKEA